MLTYLTIVAPLLLVGIVVAIAVDVVKHLAAIQQEIENVVGAIKELKEPLQQLETIQEDLNSLHSVIGGRLWKKKHEVDEDLDGPTIQRLLMTIRGTRDYPR